MTDPYADVDQYLALPRLCGPVATRDGRRLVLSRATVADDGSLVGRLWEVDVLADSGGRPVAAPGARSAAGFLPDGRLLWVDGHGSLQVEGGPGAQVPSVDEGQGVATDQGQAWRIEAVAVAVASGTIVALTRRATSAAAPVVPRGPGSDGLLYRTHPVRYWDTVLGCLDWSLLTGEATESGTIRWRELTDAGGWPLHEADVDVSPDGTTAVSSWLVRESPTSSRRTLVRWDTADRSRSSLADDGTSDWYRPRFCPCGRHVAAVRETHGSPDEPLDRQLMVVPLDGSPPRLVAPGWDRWPVEHAWCPDEESLLATADDDGRRPVFRIDLQSGAAVPLTRADAHYTDLTVAPGASTVYALRSGIGAPPAPVSIALGTGQESPLGGPEILSPSPRGTTAEVRAIGADGVDLRAWLVAPETGGAHPLVVWVHGGPLHSWNGWSWRGNPWLLVAQGYAVLLPDPALSTGYGRNFVRRGWGDWGGLPYTDVMALTDAAVERSDVDPSRVAALGGSFGGYLVNWMAGHTTRFRALISHAGIWDLEQFVRTSDLASVWTRQLAPAARADNSPSRHAERIRTPMLLIHGGADYRVPVEESLRLWWDLLSRAGTHEKVPHRFLYFPSENHYVLRPANSSAWMQAVLSFLAQHVGGAVDDGG